MCGVIPEKITFLEKATDDKKKNLGASSGLRPTEARSQKKIVTKEQFIGSYGEPSRFGKQMDGWRCFFLWGVGRFGLMDFCSSFFLMQ